MSTHVDCWHFAGPKLRDSSPLPKKGDKLALKGKPVMCTRGYHGSIRALDALNYAPGAMVARVRLSGTVLTQADKCCATTRENLTDYADATNLLHDFACWCAEKALDRVEASGLKVDPRSRKAIEVKRAWLIGKATDTELTAAWDAARAAAWDAARAAARDAAWDAAWDAARTAARTAAWAAARAAAWEAAWDAARAAAWDAAWDAENTELEARLSALLA